MDIKKLKLSSNIIKKALKEELIKRPVQGTSDFFIKKAKESIAVANRLFELEKEEKLPCSLWIINASYYSMFFSASALLAKHNKQINSEIGVHRLTYHAIVHYFVNEDNKLAKHFIESYKTAITDAEELLQLSNSKANEIITNLDFEMNKRKKFTYHLGEIAEMKKAKTSLKRAKEFVKAINEMIEK